MKCAASRSLKIQDAKIGHLRTTTLSDYIFATKACINNRKENSLNSNISSTYPHNMVNFGPLTAEIGWRIWCTPANFYGFRVLASLPHQRRSTEVNQTLHDVWPSLGLVHVYQYTFSSHNGILPGAKSLCVQVSHSPILAALLHSTPAEHISQTFLARFGRTATTWYFEYLSS